MSLEQSFSTGDTRLERIHVKAGERIFAQGEAGDAAYILNKGKIRITQHVDGQRIELDTVDSGQIFGEMAVLDGGRRAASAVAMEDSVISRVPKPIFERKLEGADRFLRALITLFIKNIRDSHRLFLRRPRSFRDHVRQTKAFSWNMRRYAGRIEERATADELLDIVERMDAVLADLSAFAERCPDKRHDLIVDDELGGVDFGNVIGTETRRII